MIIKSSDLSSQAFDGQTGRHTFTVEASQLGKAFQSEMTIEVNGEPYVFSWVATEKDREGDVISWEFQTPFDTLPARLIVWND